MATEMAQQMGDLSLSAFKQQQQQIYISSATLQLKSALAAGDAFEWHTQVAIPDDDDVVVKTDVSPKCLQAKQQEQQQQVPPPAAKAAAAPSPAPSSKNARRPLTEGTVTAISAVDGFLNTERYHSHLQQQLQQQEQESFVTHM